MIILMIKFILVCSAVAASISSMYLGCYIFSKRNSINRLSDIGLVYSNMNVSWKNFVEMTGRLLFMCLYTFCVIKIFSEDICGFL